MIKKTILRDEKGIAILKQKPYNLDENLIKNKNGLKLQSKFLTKDGREKVNVLKYFVMNQIDKCDIIYFKSALEERHKIMKKYPKPKPEDSDSDSDYSDTDSKIIESIDWGEPEGGGGVRDRYKELDYDAYEKFSDSFRRPYKNKKYIYPTYSQEDQTELDRLETQSNADVEEYRNINNRFISAITQADQSKFGEITVINDAIGENSFLYKDLTNMPFFCVNKNFDKEDRNDWTDIIGASMNNCKKNVMFIYSHTYDPENPDDPDESSVILHSVVLFRITFKKNLKEGFYSSTDSKWVLYIDLLCTNQGEKRRGRLDNPGSSRLLNLLFESAPLINIQEVVLTSHPGATKVYRKLGFRTSNEIKFNKEEPQGQNFVLVLPKKTRERDDDDVDSSKKSKSTMGGKKSRGRNRSRGGNRSRKTRAQTMGNQR